MLGWGVTQRLDSRQATAHCDFYRRAPRASRYGLKISLDANGVEVESKPQKRKKHPLRIAPAVCGLRLYAVPRRLRWERQQRGVEESLLDVSMKSRRLRQSASGSSRGLNGLPARRITIPESEGAM
jgi:hypothetical protein